MWGVEIGRQHLESVYSFYLNTGLGMELELSDSSKPLTHLKGTVGEYFKMSRWD